jgi:hypothetical protein
MPEMLVTLATPLAEWPSCSIGGSNNRDTIHGRKVNSSENIPNIRGNNMQHKRQLEPGTYRDAIEMLVKPVAEGASTVVIV